MLILRGLIGERGPPRYIGYVYCVMYTDTTQTYNFFMQ